MQAQITRSNPRTLVQQVFSARIILLLFIVIFFSIEAYAQVSDSWKAINDRGNRYEGRIEIPVSNPDLELLSFVGFMQEFDRESILKVRFFLPLRSQVIIQAQELYPEKNYWMESKPGDWNVEEWNLFEPWPTKDVLDSLHIGSSNLGIIIRLNKKMSNEIAPAFIYHSGLPVSPIKYTGVSILLA